MIDNIVLGDNQFFGVNHLSSRKGVETYEQFKDVSEIKKVLYLAMENGVTSVMLSTHPNIYQITEMMRNDDAIKNNISIYANVPYIVKYMSLVNTMGLTSTIRYVLKDKTSRNNIKTLVNSIKNISTMNYLGIACQLVDIELNPFYGLNIKAVFLHNSLCDLAMGYEMISVIKGFNDHIYKNYDAIPAYGTLNYPLFCNFLAKAQIKKTLVMTAVNKIGFLMNPDRTTCENAITKNEHTVLAMGTLASGHLKPQEAYDYIAKIGIKHVVVGLSSKKHADETFGVIRQCMEV